MREHLFRAQEHFGPGMGQEVFAGDKKLDQTGPLWDGYSSALRLKHGEKFRFYHDAGFINFAKEDDTIWYQKGRFPREWIPLYTEFVFLNHPFYHLLPGDPAPERDSFSWDYFLQQAEKATVEKDFSNTDYWVNEEVFLVLSTDDFNALKQRSEMFVWNSHGMWKKGRPLTNGKHRYMAIKLYKKRVQPNFTSRVKDYFNDYKIVRP
jgi:hypothetical protein